MHCRVAGAAASEPGQLRMRQAAGVDVQLSQIAREPDNSMSVVIKAMWDKVGLNTTITAMERLALELVELG